MADDHDREAILARRRRFIAMALGGLAAGCSRAAPQPCLNVVASPPPEASASPDPQPTQEVAARPTPQVCLSVARMPDVLLVLEPADISDRSPEEVAAEIEQLRSQGNALVATRAEAEANLWNGRRLLRQAWVLQQALNAPHQELQDELVQADAQLTFECNELLSRARELDRGEAAPIRALANEVLRRVPEADHHCHDDAQALLSEVEMRQEIPPMACLMIMPPDREE